MNLVNKFKSISFNMQLFFTQNETTAREMIEKRTEEYLNHGQIDEAMSDVLSLRGPYYAVVSDVNSEIIQSYIVNYAIEHNDYNLFKKLTDSVSLNHIVEVKDSNFKKIIEEKNKDFFSAFLYDRNSNLFNNLYSHFKNLVLTQLHENNFVALRENLDFIFEQINLLKQDNNHYSINNSINSKLMRAEKMFSTTFFSLFHPCIESEEPEKVNLFIDLYLKYNKEDSFPLSYKNVENLITLDKAQSLKTLLLHPKLRLSDTDLDLNFILLPINLFKAGALQNSPNVMAFACELNDEPFDKLTYESCLRTAASKNHLPVVKYLLSEHKQEFSEELLNSIVNCYQNNKILVDIIKTSNPEFSFYVKPTNLEEKISNLRQKVSMQPVTNQLDSSILKKN